MIRAMIEVKGIDPKMIANNIEPFESTHPGELLRDEIECRHISQKQLAADMGVSYTVLNDIVNCKRPVNTKFALLCEAALGVPAHILLGLQSDYDMQTAKNDKSLLHVREMSVNLWLHFEKLFKIFSKSSL